MVPTPGQDDSIHARSLISPITGGSPNPGVSQRPKSHGNSGRQETAEESQNRGSIATGGHDAATTMKNSLLHSFGYLAAIGVVCAFAVTSRAAVGQPAPQRAAMQAFMRQKLVSSQSLLEGLTLEKFDLVQKSAIRLRKMTQTNSWSTSRNVLYLERMTNYQASLDVLWEAASRQDLAAATDAYAQVTRNCVECHRVVRVDQHNRAVKSGAQ